MNRNQNSHFLRIRKLIYSVRGLIVRIVLSFPEMLVTSFPFIAMRFFPVIRFR